MLLRFVEMSRTAFEDAENVVRLRQRTATQGFDGTNWKFGPFPTTVTRSLLRSWLFIS